MKVGEWMESRMQDALMIGVLVASFAWLIIVGSLLPEYAEIFGPIGYFVIIFGGLFGTEIAVREYVNSYPYLRLLVRPENRWLHVFLKPPGATRRVGPDMYSTTLDLRFPIKFDGHMVKRIELHHTGQWSERIKFRRGTCVWSGFSVPHPQTEILEVYRVPKASVMVDRSEVVPVFILKSASQDYYRPAQLSIEPVFNAEDLITRLETLEAQLAEAERQKSEWHQRAVAAEEIAEQQKAEIRGLMETKSGLKELAYEYMLTIYQACGSIEKALQKLKGTTISREIVKYIAVTVISLAVIALLWANPNIVEAIASNVLFLIVIIVVAVAAIVYITRRRK